MLWGRAQSLFQFQSVKVAPLYINVVQINGLLHYMHYYSYLGALRNLSLSLVHTAVTTDAVDGIYRLKWVRNASLFIHDAKWNNDKRN